MLVRLNHSHIRIGSFQRLKTLGETDALKRLVAYSLRHYFGEDDSGDAPLRLLRHVVAGTARMAAGFMAAGFVHGVLNSDNINITGESFDYGPWRFAPRFEAGFTAAYFDGNGLYAFGRQAEAIHWDVAQLAISLSDLASEEDLIEALGGFGPAYFAALVPAMLWRLGVKSAAEEADRRLVAALELGLSESRVGIDRLFFDWRGGECRNSAAYSDAAFDAFKQAIAAHSGQGRGNNPYWAGEDPCSMLIEEVEAIWAPIAESDDWSSLYAKVAAIRQTGEALRSV